MSKTFLKITLGLLAMAALVWPATATASEKILPGHVPKVVSQLTATGKLNSTNLLHLAIGLPLRNQSVMNALLQQMYDPANASYHKFLTPAEFAAQFGPTEDDYQTVINFAKTNGLTVTGTCSNRTMVVVAGKVADIEKAFHVHMLTYRHPTEGRQFFAPDTEPTVDASLPVLSVYGLNNYILPRPLYHKEVSKGKSLDHLSTGSAPGGTYWGYDFRNAYAPGVAQVGTGQKVALFECDGYYPTDVSSYLLNSGLPSVALTTVLIDGATGQPSGTGGEVEVALDIDMANSMAPGLAGIIVYEAPDDTPAYNLDQLNRIATDDLTKQISSSWLIDDTPQFAQIYIQFALQGQSFFQASGDSGAYYPGIFQFEDSPLVTLVGGTTLTSTGPGGVWASERVWNDGYDPGDGHEDAGGGGVSSVYSIPSWQTWINMTTNKGSTTMRNIPDVALTADNIYIFGDGSPLEIGGTSCAAPLWAGFMSLVNQQLASNSESPIGFINPSIYSLAQGSNYPSIFHDIVVGNNTNLVSTTLYDAVPGYDLCTGLGTPNGTNLISALTSFAVTNSNLAVIIPPPQQPWGNALTNLTGTDPNGFWFLYMQDDTKNNLSGTNYNGWFVTLTTADPVGQPADIQLTVNTTANGQVYGNATNFTSPPGVAWTSTLSVTNYGPSPTTNVVVTDNLPLPPGVTLVSSNYSIPGSVIAVSGPTLTWSNFSLALNTGGTLTLNFHINDAGLYTNSAIVTATTTDPNPDDASIMVIADVAYATPPAITPLLSTGGSHGFQLAIANDPGAEVIIQASTNLVSWVPVYTNISPFTFTNFDTTNFDQRFYRAVVEQ